MADLYRGDFIVCFATDWGSPINHYCKCDSNVERLDGDGKGA